jgi:hypothetical protein
VVEELVAEVAAEVGVPEPAGPVAAPLAHAPATTNIAAIRAAVLNVVAIRRSPRFAESTRSTPEMASGRPARLGKRDANM